MDILLFYWNPQNKSGRSKAWHIANYFSFAKKLATGWTTGQTVASKRGLPWFFGILVYKIREATRSIPPTGQAFIPTPIRLAAPSNGLTRSSIYGFLWWEIGLTFQATHLIFNRRLFASLTIEKLVRPDQLHREK
jgi:hypothetical protein